MIQIAPWAYYLLIGIIFVSAVTNIVQAILLRSAWKQMEVDAICNL